MRFKTQVKTLSCKRKGCNQKKEIDVIEEYRLLRMIRGWRWNKRAGSGER